MLCTFLDCEQNVEKMVNESSSEHLEPMKEKMEQFISNAHESLHAVSAKLSSTQEHFDKVPFQLYQYYFKIVFIVL